MIPYNHTLKYYLFKINFFYLINILYIILKFFLNFNKQMNKYIFKKKY